MNHCIQTYLTSSLKNIDRMPTQVAIEY